MKTVPIILATLFIASVGSAAAQLTTREPIWSPDAESSLDGDWKIAERVCGFGRNSPLRRVETSDGFQIGHHDLRMNIWGARVELSGETGAFHSFWLAILHKSDHVIESVRHPTMGRKIIYRIEPDGSLTFMTDGRAACGPRPGGDMTLFTNFVRALNVIQKPWSFNCNPFRRNSQCVR